jgi:hypothetical protein
VIKPLKQKRCAVCKELYTPKRIGLKITKVCLDAGCVLDWAQGVKAKEYDKETRRMRSEMNNNDTGLWKKKAQTEFNKYIRLRDHDQPCISCQKGAGLSGKWNAGHYYTVGARGDLRFNEDNCHKQCEHCNSYNSGNIALYTPNLIAKIGIDRFNDLSVQEIKNWRIEDFKMIHQKYKLKVKELENA